MSAEREPNPVTQIITARGAQVSGVALLALAGLHVLLPPERFLPLALRGGALVTAGLSAYFFATFTAALPLGAPVMTHLPPGRGDDAIALTFDDGPRPETTPRLLEILAEHGARATFFVLGEAVTRYPDLVRRIHREGHAIGIHGLRHRTMALQSARALERDLRATLCRLEALLPTDAAPLRLLRPPYGFKSLTLSRVATRLGLRIVAWSVDPRDYDPITTRVLLARVRSRLRPRVVLLHERPGASATLDALPDLLRFCAERGWRCVTL